MSTPVVPLGQRFWSKVRVTAGCWEWQGAQDGKGYGLIVLFGRGSLGRASRVAWLLTYGPIPDGQWVLHSCDNPPCVRPDHLFLGTPADNMADMVAKGRCADHRGEKNPGAKVTQPQVADIRARYQAGGVTAGQLATEYGVCVSTIRMITTGRNWVKPHDLAELSRVKGRS